MYFPISRQSKGFLPLAVSMVSCLLLLINLSFKIIALSGLMFAANSLLCALVACLYLLALKKCSLTEQRHLLNISLMALYVFSIGIYLLVNLPAAESMHNNPVYQIVFEDIPKKFFATTLAFGLSFYLPHYLCFSKRECVAGSEKKSVLLAVLGGLSFFSIDFYFLFASPNVQDFGRIFIDSLLICAALLLTFAAGFLAWLLPRENKQPKKVAVNEDSVPLYHYLVCLAVTIMLVCLACEYRLVELNNHWMLAASGLLFPIAVIASTLIGELYGYRANLILTAVLMLAQLAFDVLLMGTVALPSPAFFDLNPYYDYILPRRIPAASLALLVAFLSNAYILDYLKRRAQCSSRAARIVIANFCSRTLLCLVNYSVLYMGIYSYEQVIHLAFNGWLIKNLTAVFTLPLVIWLCHIFEGRLRAETFSKTASLNSSGFSV